MQEYNIMKPLYRKFKDRHFAIFTYESCQEEDLFVVKIRGEKEKSEYFELVAKTAKEAAEKSWERFCKLEDIRGGNVE